MFIQAQTCLSVLISWYQWLHVQLDVHIIRSFYFKYIFQENLSNYFFEILGKVFLNILHLVGNFRIAINNTQAYIYLKTHMYCCLWYYYFTLKWDIPVFKAYQALALPNDIPRIACYYFCMKTISKQVNMTLFVVPDYVKQTIIFEKISKCASKNKLHTKYWK